MGLGQERVNSLGKQQLELSTHDQPMVLETAANLGASRSKANNFFAVFSSFELGGLYVTKHLMTGPVGNSEFCFPPASPRETLRVLGKQNSLFPVAPVIDCLIMSYLH